MNGTHLYNTDNFFNEILFSNKSFYFYVTCNISKNNYVFTNPSLFFHAISFSKFALDHEILRFDDFFG